MENLKEEILNVLNFYAEKENYNEKYRSSFNSERYDSEISLDYGEKANSLIILLNKKGGF